MINLTWVILSRAIGYIAVESKIKDNYEHEDPKELRKCEFGR